MNCCYFTIVEFGLRCDPCVIFPLNDLDRKNNLITIISSPSYSLQRTKRVLLLKMPKTLTSISGYTILPIQLPSLPSFPEGATHYIYLQPHEPRIPEPLSARSLFLVNIPIDTTETHLRHLFGAQLASGRVEQVEFHDAPKRKSIVPTATSHPVNKKKRKRVGAEELEEEIEQIELPQAWDRKLQSSGAHAVVVFVDTASMEASLKAAKRAAKKGNKIIWGEGIEDRIPALGPERYDAHERLLFPSRSDLLRSVNDYMTVYTRLEEARTREAAKKRQEPDEDGFITVTSGPKNNSVVREEEAKELVAKQKEKSKGLEDFYRFQMREKRKEKQGELVKRFEEDKRKVEEMKRRRGKVRVSYLFFCLCCWDSMVTNLFAAGVNCFTFGILCRSMSGIILKSIKARNYPIINWTISRRRSYMGDGTSL